MRRHGPADLTGMPLWRPLGACAGLSIASVVAMMLLAPAASERFAVSSWAQAATELGAAVACGAAAVHTRGRARQVWALFASGLLIWAVTDATFAWLQTAGRQVPEVSLLDVGWLAFYGPVGLATILLYLRLRPERGAQGPIDGLIITVAVASLAWVTILQEAAPRVEGGLYGTALVSLYPTLDLLCLTTLGWIVLRHKRRAPVWLYWVVAAFCLQSTASVAYLISILPGWNLDVLATAAFMGAAWCWTTAGLVRVRAPQRAWAAGTHDRPPVWSESVPFLCGVGVVGLGAVRPDDALRGAAVLVAGLMAVRAMAALRVGRGLLTERDRLLVTDPLTGAYNRRFLGEEIERAFSRAYRGAGPLSVIALDLDRFKQVNDRLGHDVGDRLLRETSAAISSGLRTSDVLCRLGGDEFLILCAATDAGGAMVVAERARASVIEVAARIAPEMGVSASLGVATFPQDAGDTETLMRNADTALYASKERGRNVVSHYAPLADEIAPFPA